MPSRDLLSLRQQVEALQQQNALLEARLASHQQHDQDFYRSLFDTMDEGFCIIEFFDGPHGPLSDYVHVLANAAYAKHAGIPNVVGQKLREMVPDEADDWVARYGAVLRTGEPLHFEQELVATGHVLSVTTFRVEPAEKRQVAVLFKDVTARRRAEQALQRLNEELEQRVNAALAEQAKAEEALRQAQKMEAVGQLSGGIAHDFNNLLGGILSAQELMRQRLEQSRFDALEPLLKLSNGSAQRASSLVHRLLAFSRQQTLQPCSTQVATLVGGMEELLRRTIGPSITLTSRFPCQLWPTFIDPPQLESALLNVCINARDAMPAGGVIDILGDNLLLDDQQARALELPAGEYVRLSISDNGKGMSAEVAERAVDPFFTTKPMGQGTGLGLSMTYGFVRQSGGQLRVLSTLGEGTRIELLLPRHHQHPEAPAPRPPRTLLEKSSSATQRILLVEDQAALRVVVCEVLEELGYRVDAFENGPAALAHLQAGERPDLLLSDIGLPGGLNGRQLAERCRERHPDLKVLFITGYDESAALSDGQLLQGTEVLTKPFELAVLAERVRTLLED
ncbi:histidine kinase [Pseudomonas putida]|uniref:histidine kinase n=2 Tax=Pseudomonas TaxID=286 RepID=A0A0P7CR80_PSEPU|nr:MULTISPECIES: response regulator [Pseudomonas]KPM59665.1 histidine kinase [Pseudomonas putida]MDM9600240.1 response regulator [Pseudomonas shirazica]MDO2413626.1 response regulator [Pseudomonas shirazica]QKK97504.1 response regulator [Pseudomonas sp. 13159349]UUC16648.1 response regulator [Pseudomonas asiatica]